MKIQGPLVISGIKLHLDIEAPDGVAELFVTNIAPNCFVIPSERWKVEWLGLPPDVLEEVKGKGKHSLADLQRKGATEDWTPRTQKLIEFSLARVREAVLMIEIPEDLKAEDAVQWDPEAKGMTLVQAPAASPKDTLIVNGTGHPNESERKDISILALPVWLEQLFHTRYGVKNLGDLCAVGRSRLLMTPKVDLKRVVKIEQALSEYGLTLG